MTQALSLYQLLEKNGHTVSHVIVGKSRRRQLPDFFIKKISAPLSLLPSPNFVTDRKSKSVSLFKTLIVNLTRVRTFLKSAREIDRIVVDEAPDIIVNFYDFLGGLYFLLKKRKVRHIAVAHQFLLDHSAFEFPKGRIYDRLSLRVGNILAGYKAERKLCLSFQAMEDEPDKKLYVVPPLLREEVKQTPASDGTHFLVYLVNHGYADQVEAFHALHPEIPIHCFWDKPQAPPLLKVDDTLAFHTLDDKKFIHLMASCKGYLTTAGFESVCEAMYMGKPVLMVPVKGHFEQACNALDAQKAGAGIMSKSFRLELLLAYLPSYADVTPVFKSWTDQTASMFLQNLTPHGHHQ